MSAALVRDPVSGVDVVATGTLAFPTGVASFTCATRVEPDQRVHIYGTEGRIEIEIPFNIPPTLPTRVFADDGPQRTRGAPETETFELPPADPYACEADAFAAAVLDGAPIAPAAVGRHRQRYG